MSYEKPYEKSYEKPHLFTSSADWAMKKPIVLAGTWAHIFILFFILIFSEHTFLFYFLFLHFLNIHFYFIFILIFSEHTFLTSDLYSVASQYIHCSEGYTVPGKVHIASGVVHFGYSVVWVLCVGYSGEQMLKSYCTLLRRGLIEIFVSLPSSGFTLQFW